MIRSLTALVLLFTVSVGPIAAAGPETKADLAGMYLCEGMNPDGTPYHGIVEIAAIDRTFLVQWTLDDGLSVIGVGVYSGGVLAVSYFGGVPAVAVYRIDGNRLVGEWTIGVNGAMYSETLTRTKSDAPRPQPPVRRTPTKSERIATL